MVPLSLLVQGTLSAGSICVTDLSAGTGRVLWIYGYIGIGDPPGGAAKSASFPIPRFQSTRTHDGTAKKSFCLAAY